jgi:hypothetical protein
MKLLILYNNQEKTLYVVDLGQEGSVHSSYGSSVILWQFFHCIKVKWRKSRPVLYIHCSIVDSSVYTKKLY